MSEPWDRQRQLPDSEFALLELLDRLESVLEEMDELGVVTRVEVEDLMNRIHARLDAMDDDTNV